MRQYRRLVNANVKKEDGAAVDHRHCSGYIKAAKRGELKIYFLPHKIPVILVG